jgi:hypothetical protein
MAKFMLLYRGPATRPEDMTQEAAQHEMQKWEAWMGKLGDQLVEPGNPFGASTALRGDGSTGEAGDLTGYTVVEADDVDAARALCDGHPFLSDGTAKFSVEAFELLSM